MDHESCVVVESVVVFVVVVVESVVVFVVAVESVFVVVGGPQ